MISARHMLDHLKDLLEDAFGEQARLRRYTRDEYPDTRIGVQCNACPWNNTSGYDTNRIINEAFLTSETYPNACLLYTSPSPRDLSTSRMPSSA